MTLTGKELGLLPCPFCGKRHDGDLTDTLYPNGTFWRQEDWGRVYSSRKGRRPGDQWCMAMHCTGCNGGCGAEISADTLEEVVAKWNRRAAAAMAG